MQYRPKTIYTRLNDVFESNKDLPEDINYDKNKYDRPKLIGKEIEKNNKNKKRQKLKNIDDNQKYKYINKDLIKSWINVVQLSKYNV